MEQQIRPFLFEGEALVRVLDRGGAPWFVGKDVAATLGYKDTAKAISAHCKRAISISTWVGDSPTFSDHKVGDSPTFLHPDTKIIPEADVFRLIFRSTLPEAERFEAWVMEEVLPAIRRTGQYRAPSHADDPEAIVSESPDSLKLRMVNTAIRAFGERVGTQVWFQQGLPMVPAMKPILSQMDLLEVETVTVTRTVNGGGAH